MAEDNNHGSGRGFAADRERAREAGRKGGKARHEGDKGGGGQTTTQAGQGGTDEEKGDGENM